ncbi:hypothetical protein K438DRAFT_1779583 [Mycena galopus ATCC 62051]|nr:hypothetical protein K438DRAFT_1779583 [Mycena galopus ATCC 62051]
MHWLHAMLYTLNEAHLPFYLFPDYCDHNNLELANIFKAWEVEYWREGGHRIRPTDPIPVVVKDVLKGKKNEEIKAEKPANQAKLEPKKEEKRGGTKRKARDEIDDEKPATRARTHQKKAKEGASKSAKNPSASRPTTRRTRAGYRWCR